MATSDEGYRRALRAARKAASAEPVVNAAAMAALDTLTADMRREADRQTDARVAGRMDWCANSLAMALARFTVRELGGEVRDG